MSSMKRKIFGPFIGQLVIASMVYIGIPLILFSLDIFDIRINPGYLHLRAPFAIIVVIFYIIFIASYLSIGMYALFDSITNNFVTKKMTYVESYMVAQNINHSYRLRAAFSYISVIAWILFTVFLVLYFIFDIDLL